MILGIAGELEVGKSETAKIIESEYGFKEMAFAKFLKETCMEVFSLPSESVYTTEGKARPFSTNIVMTKEHVRKLLEIIAALDIWTVSTKQIAQINKFIGYTFGTSRKILQIVGTEICREIFSPDFHTTIVFSEIKKNGYEKVVISDSRFPNERSMVSLNDGLNILVRCADQPDSYSGHSSETSLGGPEDYDFVLLNDKSRGLDYLKSIVVQMCKVLKI